MKILLTLALVLLASPAHADEWSDYEYLGNCVVQTEDAEDMQSKIDFYADDLEKGIANGFSVITVSQNKETEILGGYDTKYTLNKDKTEMTVVADEMNTIIPFGENVTVVSDGTKLICNTDLP